MRASRVGDGGSESNLSASVGEVTVGVGDAAVSLGSSTGVGEAMVSVGVTAFNLGSSSMSKERKAFNDSFDLVR